MQLTVKTLKGGKFVVNAEPTNTILEVKGFIVSECLLFFHIHERNQAVTF